MISRCVNCGEFHYFENDEYWCEIRTSLAPNVEILEDSDISSPPLWLEELLDRTYYPINDPNASWSLPK